MKVNSMRIALILIALILAACTNNWLYPYKMDIRQGNYIPPEMLARVKIGMTQSQVKAALGTPLLSDPFHASRWDYVYRLEQKRELVADQRLTLYFEGDRLTRIVDELNQGTSPASAVSVTQPK
jgi:outer membrane protein assembly factor BamE